MTQAQIQPNRCCLFLVGAVCDTVVMTLTSENVNWKIAYDTKVKRKIRKIDMGKYSKIFRLKYIY